MSTKIWVFPGRVSKSGALKKGKPCSGNLSSSYGSYASPGNKVAQILCGLSRQTSSVELIAGSEKVGERIEIERINGQLELLGQIV